MLGFFAAGTALDKLRDTPIFDRRVARLALAGLIASVPLRQFILFFRFFGCYLALNPRLPVVKSARRA